MACQQDLLFPFGQGDHAEVSDCNLQAGILCDDLLHFGNLGASFREVYGQDDVPFFHQSEHLHHFFAVQHHPSLFEQQAVCRNLDGLEVVVYQLFGLFKIAGLAELAHAADEKAVGIAGGNLLEIVILYAVDEFLRDYCGGYLRIVHV